jgi:ABC-type multidrug transport system ATPase subunit
MTFALEIKKISFGFAQQSKLFFNELSGQFPAGALHFVRGQNGAGKSTFFNILRGILHPQESITGTIIVDGVVHTFDKDNRDTLGSLQDDVKLVQQNFDLMLADQLSFEENLQIARLSLYPGLNPLPVREKLPAFVERFRISKQKPVHMLSGGQRQMLAILMVLQKPTKILLLDEPTAALDAHNAKMIMEFLQSLVEESGLTVLIISHDLDLVEHYAKKRYYQINIDEVTGLRSLHLIE